ncbi:Monocopper oxidase-like protein SKS2 [Heracleum sosnowskyi]|uniref:Monocopper oxidase-like protein SKS2 n=1 Tax=Heracleum sosnowskyi TaxID=360622 RepID=A0AAD8HWY9_9APIA|nr:Monocopper oxidase-like protein SKS2 [Heracleum sosnowskyi]
MSMREAETLVPDPISNQEPTHQHNSQSEEEEEEASPGEMKSSPSPSSSEIIKAIEVVERDSTAIAQSFTSLFASLRSSLSQVTGRSVDHLECFNDAAGRLQECTLDAATKGNRYINSCLRLNEEMKGMDILAAQLKILRRNVDALDSNVNRLLRLP